MTQKDGQQRPKRTKKGVVEWDADFVMEQAADRLRYEQEIEQLEESWKAESRDLLQSIGQLQDQNRKLQVRFYQCLGILSSNTLS